MEADAMLPSGEVFSPFHKPQNDFKGSNHRVSWEDTKEVCGRRLLFTGRPFFIIGNKKYDCQHGKDRNAAANTSRNKQEDGDFNFKKRQFNAQPTKKKNCPARLILCGIIVFPGYKGSGLSQPVDTRIIKKIEELVKKGVKDTYEMRRHLKIFVKKELFTENNAPSSFNRRFFPKMGDIRSHMYRATVKNRWIIFTSDRLKRLAWSHSRAMSESLESGSPSPEMSSQIAANMEAIEPLLTLALGASEEVNTSANSRCNIIVSPTFLQKNAGGDSIAKPTFIRVNSGEISNFSQIPNLQTTMTTTDGVAQQVQDMNPERTTMVALNAEQLQYLQTESITNVGNPETGDGAPLHSFVVIEQSVLDQISGFLKNSAAS
ncbi:predicted protein, partial [Nematostella vectensis]